MKFLKHIAKHRYRDKDEDSKLSSDEVLDNFLKDLEEILKLFLHQKKAGQVSGQEGRVTLYNQ